MKLQDAINGFLTHCQFEKRLSSQTIKAYSTDLNQFCNFALRKKVCSNIKKIDKIALKEYLQELASLKTKSIKRKIATVKAMFNYLEYENEDFNNPFHRIKIRLKDSIMLPVVMSINEVQQFLGELYKQVNSFSQDNANKYKTLIRDIAVIELLFATGMRVSELCQLTVNNINLEEGTIKILGKGNKERVIQICQSETIRVLVNYKNLYIKQIQNSSFFFYKPDWTKSVLTISKINDKKIFKTGRCQ